MNQSSASRGLHIAFRTLWRQPGFAIVVVLSLALGIALDTTMYSVLDALVHPRLDIPAPDRLYTIRFYGDYRGRTSHAERDAAVRSGLHNIERFAWFDGVPNTSAIIDHEGRYRAGSTTRVSADYFGVVQPKVIAGRTFIAADIDASVRPIVLSQHVAEALFQTANAAVGANVRLNDTAYTVVGVLSAYSDFPDEHTLAWTVARPTMRGMYARLIRLRPGARLGDADRELQTIAARLAIAAGEAPGSTAFRLRRISDSQFHYNNFHIALAWSVAAVLLIACANLGNLQLARGIGRRRELALRTALGATRAGIIRQLLTETLLLGAGGLTMGLILTAWGIATLRSIVPPSVGAFVVEPQISWRVLLFAALATVASIVLIGLIPAAKVSRVDPNEMLKSGAGTGATRQHRRQYGLLVAIEIALALALLSGAAVMVRAAIRVRTLDLGFDPMPLTVGVIASPPSPNTPDTRSSVQAEIVQRLRSIAKVKDASTFATAGLAGHALVIGDSTGGLREIAAPASAYHVVSPSYFRTMGMRVVRGRDFFEGERDSPAVIVDDYTARKLWPNANPVGALIKLGDRTSSLPFVRVVGVVGNAHLSPRATRGDPSDVAGPPIGNVYYLPGPNDVLPFTKSPHLTQVVVRAVGDAAELPPLLMSAGMRTAETMDESLGITRAKQSRAFVAEMFGLFAALGIALAVFGVYGIVAHSVAERRRELGVRIALGASMANILHSVLRESVAIGLAGTALGLLATKYGVLLLRAFAFEDDLYNVTMFASAAAVLLLAAALSALIPAMRATRVDPTESLRSE